MTMQRVDSLHERIDSLQEGVVNVYREQRGITRERLDIYLRMRESRCTYYAVSQPLTLI